MLFLCGTQNISSTSQAEKLMQRSIVEEISCSQISLHYVRGAFLLDLRKQFKLLPGMILIRNQLAAVESLESSRGVCYTPFPDPVKELKLLSFDFQVANWYTESLCFFCKGFCKSATRFSSRLLFPFPVSRNLLLGCFEFSLHVGKASFVISSID